MIGRIPSNNLSGTKTTTSLGGLKSGVDLGGVIPVQIDTGATSNFYLLIDSTHYFLIDDTHKLIIE